MFFTNQGTQGILGRASKQQLENTFATTVEMEVLQQVLEKGKPEHSEGIRSSNMGATNFTMGSQTVDTKGKGLRGI